MSSQLTAETTDIGATGVLANELGSQQVANPSGPVDPSSTGIPIISNDNDVSALPPVDGSVPNSPVTSPSTLRHGSVSGSATTQARAQSTPARHRRNPLRADPARPGNTLPDETADEEAG